MASFVPYQIDYSVKNAAKTIAFSKKRVAFKFGFASPDSLKDGSSQGPACRGSEHEVTFVWSLATGKRQLLLDNKDLHFSESGQNGWTTDRVWQHAFTVRDASTGHSYRALFISQAAVNPRDNSPQHPFDLRIGGISYFQFNALYQLGTSNMVTHQEQNNRSSSYGGSRSSYSSNPHHSGRDSPMNAEERRQLASAKLASLQDIAQREAEQKIAAAKANAAAPPASMKHEEASLISFDDPTPPPVPVATSMMQQPVTSIGGVPTNPGAHNNQYFASSLTLDPMLDHASNHSQGYHAGGGGLPATSNHSVGLPPTYGANPYGAPAPAPLPPSSMPPSYSVNPYAAAPMAQTSNPYDLGSNPYGMPPADANSQALTPYNSMASLPPADPNQALTPYNSMASLPPANPYVDATGRFAMGQPPPPPPQPLNNNFYDMSSAASAAPVASNNPYNLASPGAVSYGSAPSFAQPPPAAAAPAPFYGNSAPNNYYAAAAAPAGQPPAPPGHQPQPYGGGQFYAPAPAAPQYNY